MTDRTDIAVLGAGMVGVSAALHLLRRGHKVTLIDRREPGEETSHGNAGIIEGGVYVPLAFPRAISDILAYAGNAQSAMHYNPWFLPRVVPWLYALYRNSSKEKLLDTARRFQPMISNTIPEHRALMQESGAMHYARDTGWLLVFRSEEQFQAENLARTVADEIGVRYRVLTPEEVIAEVEPNLKPAFAKAVHWNDVWSVSSPGGVTKTYGRLFSDRGGEFSQAAIRGITQTDDGWRVETDGQAIESDKVVICLGPWSSDLVAPLGYNVPLAAKRGYHTHYGNEGAGALTRPVVDTGGGFCFTPMETGVRLTTGIEFDHRDAPPTPVQLGRALKRARELYPLGEALDPEPWMGRRPCFPDSLPMIGPVPRHEGLWFNFGHAHLGFTLGPVSGRLLAEMMAGEETFVDSSLYSPTRFD